MLARAYLEYGDKAHAVADFNKAMQIDKRNLVAVEAMADYELSELQPEKAEKLWLDFISDHPNNGIARLRLGDVYESKGEMNRAKGQYTEALKISDKCQMAYFLRAKILTNQLDYKGAISDCTKAIELDVMHAFVDKCLKLRATCYDRIGQYHNAIADLTAILTGHYQDIPVSGSVSKNLMFRVELHNKLREYDKALDDVKIYLNYKPQSTEALLKQAQINALMGNYALALKQYDDLLKKDSQLPEWHRGRASVLTRLKRDKEAQQELDIAKKQEAL
jgi:tetratricopeptide (TPR) repeat protein